MRSWPFEGAVDVPVPPKPTPIAFPFHVPVRTVPRETAPVPETEREEIEEVVRVACPRLSILTMLLSLREVVALRMSPDIVPAAPMPAAVEICPEAEIVPIFWRFPAFVRRVVPAVCKPPTLMSRFPVAMVVVPKETTPCAVKVPAPVALVNERFGNVPLPVTEMLVPEAFVNEAVPSDTAPTKLDVPETVSELMLVVASVVFPCATNAPVVVTEVNVAVEGVLAPIGVLLMVPPVIVAPDDARLFAVRSPLTVVVASVAAP
jgi:hypothetical protein